jgi:hypothetical protein
MTRPIAPPISRPLPGRVLVQRFNLAVTASIIVKLLLLDPRSPHQPTRGAPT